jgi:hypothetical protein
MTDEALLEQASVIPPATSRRSGRTTSTSTRETFEACAMTRSSAALRSTRSPSFPPWSPRNSATKRARQIDESEQRCRAARAGGPRQRVGELPKPLPSLRRSA